MPKGSVKIMLSYDYCHFEVALASDEDMTLEQIDSMRKDAQRLADKAVHQYKLSRDNLRFSPYNGEYRKELERKAKIIKENFPKSEWTPEQKAAIKAFEDFEYYDYQDEWSDPEN